MTYVCGDCHHKINDIVHFYCVPNEEKYLCKNCLKCEECGVFLWENYFKNGGSYHIWYTCPNHVDAVPREIKRLENNWQVLRDKLLRGELISAEQIRKLNQIREEIASYWRQIK